MLKFSHGLLVAGILLFPCFAPAADLKIATVSMERLFDEYHKTKDANARFKARADEIELRRREMLADLKTRKNELDELGAEIRDTSLNEAERNKKRAQAEAKFTQAREAEARLLEFDKTSKQQIGEQMRTMQQQFVTEIRGVLQAYIKDRGFTLVLDSSGKTMNNVEAVLIADKSFDITDAILAIINKDAPPAATNLPPALKPVPVSTNLPTPAK
jgi:Skp family chaperone for outer membrane proteins